MKSKRDFPQPPLEKKLPVLNDYLIGRRNARYPTLLADINL
jgi:hypothetical protein